MRRLVSIMLAAIMLLTLMESSFAAASGVPPASRYKGYTKQAYEAVHKYPQVAAALFCYCGCDKAEKHRRLIDCYKDEHAVSCSICQDEMIRGATYKKQGMSISAIQDKIDFEFKKNYPYNAPSPALSRYRSLHKKKS